MSSIKRATIVALATAALGSASLNAANADDYGTYVPGHCYAAVPGTDTGVVCEAHGWRIRHHFSITPRQRLAWTDYPACPTEDSVACFWDAQVQGNHHGRSFVVTRNSAVWYVK